MAQAAAALIGLLFVVITIAVDRRPDSVSRIGAYLTTTVVYFASVLGVAELLTIPDHTRLTVTLCITLIGIPGLIYAGYNAVGREIREKYVEKRDALTYAVFPFFTYALLQCGAILIRFRVQLSLNLIAASLMLLLLLGIRNSWSVVVDVVSTKRR